MMKKKTLATLLTLTMLTTAAVPAFAAGTAFDKDTDKGTTEITYKVDSTYTITIPVDVDLASTTKTGAVTIADAKIPFGQSLNIKVTSTNYDKENSKFRLKDGAKENYIDYKINDGSNDIANEAIILSAAAGTTEKTVNLTFSLVNSEQNIAGSYADTLTFTAAVE